MNYVPSSIKDAARHVQAVSSLAISEIEQRLSNDIPQEEVEFLTELHKALRLVRGLNKWIHTEAYYNRNA